MRRCYKYASDDSHNTCVMKFLVCPMGFRFRWETSAHKKARRADPVRTRIFLLDSGGSIQISCYGYSQSAMDAGRTHLSPETSISPPTGDLHDPCEALGVAMQ